MEIALIEPEIPGNTGSIGRLCVGTATRLHLVGKLGFSISDKMVKRAGLDYWKDIDLHVHPDVDTWFEAMGGRRLHLYSARGPRNYAELAYGPDDVLVFGCETRGFPQRIRTRFHDALVRIPTNPMIRSLNLANAASVVLYEALRQQDFLGLDR